MITLKEQYKALADSDMKKGEIAIIRKSYNPKQIGMLILRGYSYYVDLGNGDFYGANLEMSSGASHPDWVVELVEPGTELVIN